MEDDDRVFKALADPTRRHLLDQLFERDGRTLGELQAGVDMTRFGVMKHLGVLEDAQTDHDPKVGSGKAALFEPGAHPIDARPLDRQVHRAPGVGAHPTQEQLGESTMTTASQVNTMQVYQIVIRATPQQIWDAITQRSSPASTFTAPESTRPPRPARRSATTRRTATCGATTRSWNPTHRTGWW
jgi:hypothetical protein